MGIFIAIALFVFGLAILIFGAEYLVKGAAAVASRLRVPPLAIGLTIVAFGTSTPELTVNIYAALSGSTDLAVGNIIGSNIANILLILGAAAIITPLAVKSSTVWKEMPFALLGGIMVLALGADFFISGTSPDILTRGDGIALLGVFTIFMYYIVGLARANAVQDIDAKQQYSFLTSTLYIVGGLAALVFGGKLLVDQAVYLAQLFGLSEAIIGFTVVAVGTSLPELATSIIAARRGQVDIAVGNVIGSNIFNIFWILGITAIIAPLPVPESFVPDILMEIVVSIALFAIMFVGTRHTVDRWQGWSFIGAYFLYILYLLTFV